MLPTPQPWNEALDAKSGLVVGQEVSVAPDDTGRDDPVRGILLRLSAEEIVIKPADLGEGQKAFVEGVRIHFPRVGFVFRPCVGSTSCDQRGQDMNSELDSSRD